RDTRFFCQRATGSSHALGAGERILVFPVDALCFLPPFRRSSRVPLEMSLDGESLENATLAMRVASHFFKIWAFLNRPSCAFEISRPESQIEPGAKNPSPCRRKLHGLTRRSFEESLGATKLSRVESEFAHVC